MKKIKIKKGSVTVNPLILSNQHYPSLNFIFKEDWHAMTHVIAAESQN